MRLTLKLATAMIAATVAGVAQAAPINVIAPGSLTGTGLVTFDDVAGGTAPGTNYDAVFVSGNVAFAERFVGQSVTGATFDAIVGTPNPGLMLAVGVAGQNLNVFDNGPSQVLTGLGPLGFPDFGAIGEGSIALRFGLAQSEFGFDLVGGDGGNAIVSFYRADGSLIDTVILTGLSNQSYAFQRDGGVQDIAGITITNTDPAGIGFDTLRYNVEGGNPVDMPEPGTLALLGAGLLGLGALRRRRRG